MKKIALALLCAAPLAGHAFEMIKTDWGKFEYDFEEKPWKELETRLPPTPKEENLLPFFVSAATTNRFFVDAASVARGDDGVVRFTLVVKSDEGARNVTFEGIRCKSGEVKRYAIGRDDGSWSKARNSAWEGIGYKDANRHHFVLYDDFFCPRGIIVDSTQEAVDALRRGTKEKPGIVW